MTDHGRGQRQLLSNLRRQIIELRKYLARNGMPSGTFRA